MGTTCWLCSDLSACLRGKSTLTVVFHCVPVRGPLNRHGVAWTGCLRRRYSPCQDTGMPPALPPAAPSVVAHDSHSMGYPRMSHAIPRPCVASRIRIVGIATFVDAIEHSLSRIVCETALSECWQRARGPASSPPDRRAASPRAPARTWARSCARGPSDPRLDPLMRAWVR